ncbi:MAG: anaerobic glycerol-3-phosphate dehydrogenase subunit C [Deinococcus sp.]|nr:anaerobic glycerol-3-phosphate dehydrogenase subunit C [Deinococcus sp.]
MAIDSRYDVKHPQYWDAQALHSELERIFDICHGCRLCFNLCPSFPALFNFVDQRNLDAPQQAPPGEFDQMARQVVDLCYQCKLCYNKCPYTPPHEFMLDFPQLMLRAKAQKQRQQGMTLGDRVLGSPDLLGQWGSALAPLSNAANRFLPARVILEKTIGIHRDRNLPEFHKETFARWFSRRPKKPGSNGRVALFYTCSVNYNDPDVGKACVAVLEHNGIEVICPEQECCGMPYLDSGNIGEAAKRAERNARRLAEYVRSGYDIVSPGPSCSLMLKAEAPHIVQNPEAELVAAHTFDLCQYLMQLHGQKKLNTSFTWRPGKIAYHLPCHLKHQNIGLKSRDLLRLIPGAEVELIDRCSAMDGTWGMKTQYFQLSQQVAQKLYKGIERSEPQLVVSDCSLAGLQIIYGTKRPVLHPVEVLARAYGLAV